MSERESWGIKMRAGSGCGRSAMLRWSFALATLAALVLALAAPSWAQTQGTATQAAAPKAAAEPGASAGQSAAKGQHEGIVVYGRWVIEVKNPDGKVVEHREFENNLFGTGGEVGSNLLAGLISGVYTPGAWSIVLLGNGPGPSGPPLSPCSAAPECLIVPANENAALLSAQSCSASVAAVSGSSTQPWCYSTLVESLTGTSSFATGFTLSGSVYADTTTYVTVVSSQESVCSQPGDFQSAAGKTVASATLSTVAPSDCLSGEGSGATFTSATLPGTGVSVTAGQTIEATVNFSFSSPQ